MRISISHQSLPLWKAEKVALLEEAVIDLGRLEKTVDLDQPLFLESEFYRLELFLEKAVSLKRLILYDGSVDLRPFFQHSIKYQELYRISSFNKGEKQFQVFCLDQWLNYLQRLSSMVPDSIQIGVRYRDTEQFEKGLVAQLLSQSRTPYWSIEPRLSESKEAFLLPQDSKIDDLFIETLSALLTEKEMRILPEVMATELWDGVNVIYVHFDRLTDVGKRALLGFEASEGKVIYL